MSRIVFAAALSGFLLAACGGREQEPTPNAAAETGANALENGSLSHPGQPGSPVDGLAEPVPPPDAVSHPEGYLPPAPGEPDPANVNSSAPGASPPATEDEYIRNRQSGR